MVKNVSIAVLPGLAASIVLWLAAALVPLSCMAAGTPRIIPVVALDKICLGKTFLVKDRPFRKVVVGDANIASVRALAPDQLLIKGLRPGRTNLIFWYDDDRPPGTFDVRVVIDPDIIAEAEAMVRELVPAARVRIIPVNAEILLEGVVDSIADMHRVAQIIRPFFTLSDEAPAGEGESGKASTTINISTGDSGTSRGESNQSQLEQNLSLTLAIRNNLVVVRGRQQVQLKIKIAEVSRSGAKQMGLSFLSNQDWAVGVMPGGEATGGIISGTSHSIMAVFSKARQSD